MIEMVFIILSIVAAILIIINCILICNITYILYRDSGAYKIIWHNIFRIHNYNYVQDGDKIYKQCKYCKKTDPNSIMKLKSYKETYNIFYVGDDQ